MNPARFPGLLHHLPIEKEQWHHQRSGSGSMAPEITFSGTNSGNSLKDLEGSLNLCHAWRWTGHGQLNRVEKHSALASPLQEQGLGHSNGAVTFEVILVVFHCSGAGQNEFDKPDLCAGHFWTWKRTYREIFGVVPVLSPFFHTGCWSGFLWGIANSKGGARGGGVCGFCLDRKG